MVVFTASEDEDLERRCLELGAREFKVKPADYSELVTIVQHVLKVAARRATGCRDQHIDTPRWRLSYPRGLLGQGVISLGIA